jgi:PASTA domain
VTFAAGLVAGLVATAVFALLVFKARVIAGRASTRLPNLSTVVAVIALVVAVIALVRSGDAGSRSTAPPGSTSDPPTTAPLSSTVVSTSTTRSSVLATITVPNVVGLSQSAATSELQHAGLRSRSEPLPLSSVPAGFVVTQTPGAFSTTTSNAVVVLGVSAAA